MAAIRGIDHAAMTVPDIEEATRFLEDAFGARMLFDGAGPGSPVVAGPEAERAFGMPEGGSWDGRRMLAVGDSVIELFHYRAEGARPAARTFDHGWQHVAFLADDVQAAAQRFEEAGGTLMDACDTADGRPGPRTQWIYGKMPWGAIVEIVDFPAR